MSYYLSGGSFHTLNSAAQILDAGGNAYDAAISALCTSFIAEPPMSSAGGGAFALIKPKGKKVKALNFFCKTPQQKPKIADVDLNPVHVQFGEETERFYAGYGSHAVPLMIKGIFALHERYGSMPMPALMEQAIHQAKYGIEMNAFQQYDLNLLKNFFQLSERGSTLFYDENGAAKAIGEKVKMPYLADFLDVLSREGDGLFYEGEVGQRLVQDAQANGGIIKMDDLRSSDIQWLDCWSSRIGAQQLHTFPSPSLGGGLLIWLLNQMNKSDKQFPLHQKEHIEKLAAISKQGVHLQKNPELLLKQLGLENNIGPMAPGGTSHMNIIDHKGNAVCVTFTIGEGSGYFIPGTDIHMNNMMGELALLPKGLHSWEPGKYMSSMMTPSMATNLEGDLQLVFGTGGAGRIPFILAQFFENVFRYNLPLDVAIEMPRVIVDNAFVHLEKGIERMDFDRLGLEAKFWTKRSLFFGGVNALSLYGDKSIEAYGDKRRQATEIVKH